MVDENELAGKLRPQQVFEHINVGCDLIDGTWEEFHQAIGLRSVSVGTEPLAKTQSLIPVTGTGGDNKTRILVFL
jgi:hypothetical protein